MVRLITFGGLGLRSGSSEGGQPAEGRVPRRSMALLVLLAASSEAPVTRDKVLALLWPESDQERARNALRQVLHGLRREVGAEVVAGGEDLRLNTSMIGSDLREFEDARSSGRLEQAAAVYAGAFLDGFHLGGAPDFERWVERKRSELAGQASGVFESLARGASERSDHQAAERWWRRIAAHDPLNGRVAVELMNALVAGGNAAAALQHARVYDAFVREELGTAPDPAVAGLAEKIRSQGVLGGSISVAAQPARPPTSHPKERPTGAARLLERLREAVGDRYAIDGNATVGRDGNVRLVTARDIRHDRRVVLRVLQPPLASQLDLDRFLREIRLTARLHHSNILPLLDSGEVDGRAWYAQPHREGEMLRVRLARDGRIALSEALGYACELADALEHAHRHGIVHRDVTPESILLAEGSAMLSNFGVARAIDAAAGSSLTETGMTVGSIAYASPEQAAGKRALDGRSDIFSLACVVFEMLGGEPLFSGPTPQAIAARRGGGVKLRIRLDGVPAPIASVLSQALATDPRERPVSAADFARMLRAAHLPPEGQ